VRSGEALGLEGVVKRTKRLSGLAGSRG